MASNQNAAPLVAKRRAANTRGQRGAQGLPAELPSRVIIRSVEPSVDGGRYPAKCVAGEPLAVSAVAFADGHDHLRVELLWRQAGSTDWNRTEMVLGFNDRWSAEIVPASIGSWEFTVEAYVDRFETWLAGLAKLVDAHRVTAAELLDGAAQLVAAAERADVPAERSALEGSASVIGAATPEEALATARAIEPLARKWQDRGVVASLHAPMPLLAERQRAGHGAWYELFPRSAGEDGTHGTLRDVIARLPEIAGMGFDVLYLPPIHPIGSAHRKGPNNTLTPGPDDPGSPWAIGSKDGGHTEIHPELGTLDDFADLVAAAADHGIEIALDIAFQCSPDHPWVTEHPGWFRHLPDGSIRCAENPPKKYEDIFPFDFECEDWRGLWVALRDVVTTWASRGVRVFRVDNPHTKPVAFWEWMIRSVRETYPDAVFLAEAFTRPAMLQTLARAGFSQSYTYFTWRNTRYELQTFMTEMSKPPVSDFLRPNLWPNTPDILPEYLQASGRPGFIIRFVLAATLGANYGLYGPPYELGVGQARDPGSEEYIDSEKYQVRSWNTGDEWSLRPLIARVNAIRKKHPALLQDRTLHFHETDNEQIIAYSKSARGGDSVLIVVNLDPHYRQSGHVTLDTSVLGLPPDAQYQVHDLLGEGRFIWRGARNFIELDPHSTPAHIFALRHWARSEQNFEYYL